MPNEETLYPFEFMIRGIPISLQASNATREAWEERVRDAARVRQLHTYELGFLDHRALAVTIYYFPSDPMDGDIDNIVKPILDGLAPIAYLDDKFVERVVVQKFEPLVGWELAAPSDQLAQALDMEPPVVYVRVDDDLSWRFI